MSAEQYHAKAKAKEARAEAEAQALKKKQLKRQRQKAQKRAEELERKQVEADERAENLQAAADRVTRAEHELKEARLALNQLVHQIDHNSSSNNSTGNIDHGEPPHILSNECVICLDDIAKTAFNPCGHVVSCGDCASSVTTCPICRMDIISVINL